MFTSKSTRELMAIFESLSGSAEFARDCDAFEQSLEKINREIIEKSEKLREIKRDKRNTKNLIEGEQKVKDLSQQLEAIEARLFDLKINYYDQNIKILEQESYLNQTKISELMADADKLASEAGHATDQSGLLRTRKELERAAREEKGLEKQVGALRETASSTKEEVQRIRERQELHAARKARAKNELQEIQAEKRNLQAAKEAASANQKKLL